MLDKLIFFLYALVFAFVPFFWTPINYELFEYNKMVLVYGLTILIVGSWFLKMINHRSLIINRTPLDIPLLLFLLANVLATIFSIDRHSSIWGYYSRSNGGLLSLISYLLLYFGFVSNIDKQQAFKLLKMAIFSGVIISLWAIFEHFGVSPSCVLLRGEFNANCWIQDVQARVFATLGQPNWLAGYLAMLIFPCLYFILSKPQQDPSALPQVRLNRAQDDNLRLKILHKLSTIRYTLYAITLYCAFTFTYSRGATLGLLAGVAIFLALHIGRTKILLRASKASREVTMKPLSLILLSFFVVNLLFGSALNDFKLISKFAPAARPAVSITPSAPTSTTQLETGGSESGQIRLIVWQGALDIFRHYPIFGSGLETFAYSYYSFRPVSHNLVTEWDFLYNKAHNEFLNYLATTGAVGFSTYILVILIFIFWNLKFLFVISRAARNLKVKSQNLEISHLVRDDRLLVLALLASYISYLVQNFFGFSVVIIAVFFFLFPAIAFVTTGSIRPLIFPKKLYAIRYILYAIYHRSLYTRTVKLFVLLVTCYLLLSVIRIWYADTLFATGYRYNEIGNAGQAYNFLSDATTLNKNEPFFRSELGYAAAASALVLSQENATLSSQLKDEAIVQTAIALNESPRNVSFWRTAIRTFFELSGIDQSYLDKTIQVTDQSIKLAPTDPKLYYNKAVILGQTDKKEEAIKALEKAIELKPNYRDAYVALATFYETTDKKKAVEILKKSLQVFPEDPEVADKIKKLEEK